MKQSSSQEQMDQTLMPMPQAPLANRFNSHQSCQDSNQCDDHQYHKLDHSHHHDGDTPDSRNQHYCGDAQHHLM
uniref:Uncharacterized protein n=1 Tax=Romanomermis culicivorax TaxID=13658 RepID=A0A915JR33_ROMCU